MERAYLVAAVIALVISWIYILALQKKVSDCMSYLRREMARRNPGAIDAGIDARSEDTPPESDSPERDVQS